MEKIEAIDLEVRKPKEKNHQKKTKCYCCIWEPLVQRGSNHTEGYQSHLINPVLLSSPFSATKIFALLKIHLLFSSPHRQLRATVVFTIVQLAHISSNFLYYPGSWHVYKGCNLCLMAGDINLFGWCSITFCFNQFLLSLLLCLSLPTYLH